MIRTSHSFVYRSELPSQYIFSWIHIVWDWNGYDVNTTLNWYDNECIVFLICIFIVVLNYHLFCRCYLIITLQVNMRLKWVLENNEMVRHLANEGHVMFGTIDTWLVYRLTEGKVRMNLFYTCACCICNYPSICFHIIFRNFQTSLIMTDWTNCSSCVIDLHEVWTRVFSLPHQRLRGWENCVNECECESGVPRLTYLLTYLLFWGRALLYVCKYGWLYWNMIFANNYQVVNVYFSL